MIPEDNVRTNRNAELESRPCQGAAYPRPETFAMEMCPTHQPTTVPMEGGFANARSGQPVALEWRSPSSGISTYPFETMARMPSSIRPDGKSATNWRALPESVQPSYPCMDTRRVNPMFVSGTPFCAAIVRDKAADVFRGAHAPEWK